MDRAQPDPFRWQRDEDMESRVELCTIVVGRPRNGEGLQWSQPRSCKEWFAGDNRPAVVADASNVLLQM